VGYDPQMKVSEILKSKRGRIKQAPLTTMTQTALGKLLAFLDQLEQQKLHYRLSHVRDSIMVEIAVPGERWEVEFFDNGEIEIERFVSTGVNTIDDAELNSLVVEYSE
jgi:hypothetical protein